MPKKNICLFNLATKEAMEMSRKESLRFMKEIMEKELMAKDHITSMDLETMYFMENL